MHIVRVLYSRNKKSEDNVVSRLWCDVILLTDSFQMFEAIMVYQAENDYNICSRPSIELSESQFHEWVVRENRLR